MNGIPLIHYSIQMAYKFKTAVSENYNVDLFLSTDSDEIKAIAKKVGLETEYVRSAGLSNDTVGKVQVIRHALAYAEERFDRNYYMLLDLDVSSPLRSLENLLDAFNLFNKNAVALTMFSVNKAHKNPYFNMVELNENGYAQIAKPRGRAFLSRQDSPVVYELNASFYFYRDTFFKASYNTPITPRSMIFEMKHPCFDIDHEIDFKFMEYLLSNNFFAFSIS